MVNEVVNDVNHQYFSMIQVPKENTDTENKEEKISISMPTLQKFFLFLVALLFLSVFLFKPSVNKSDVAVYYKVSVKTLMKWISLFCPQHLVVRYVGTKKQKMKSEAIYPHLGQPSDYPKDNKDRVLNERKAIWRAFDIGEDTLSRRIKEIEKPEETIGMSLNTYRKLRSFPPKQSQLIVNFLKEKGYPKESSKHCLP